MSAIHLLDAFVLCRLNEQASQLLQVHYHVEFQQCHDVQRSSHGCCHQGIDVQPLEDLQTWIFWNWSVIWPNDVRTGSTAFEKYALLCRFRVADHQVPSQLNRFRGAALSPNPGSRATHATSHGPNGSMEPTSRRRGGVLGDALGDAECECTPDNHSPFLNEAEHNLAMTVGGCNGSMCADAFCLPVPESSRSSSWSAISGHRLGSLTVTVLVRPNIWA